MLAQVPCAAANRSMTDIDRIKLFHYPATRSSRVKWALHEVLDDNFEVERVSLYEGEQYEEDFLAMNPNHGVPTLELTRTDGSVRYMFESGAIVTWLADAFPDKGLAPQAVTELSMERADYLQMLHFASSWIDMMLWQIRIQEHVLPDAAKDLRTVGRYRLKFGQEVEPQLQARRSGSPLICGERVSAADIMVGHCVLRGRLYGMCEHSAFAGYVERLAMRPAFGKAFADVGEFQAEPPSDTPLRERFTG